MCPQKCFRFLPTVRNAAKLLACGDCVVPKVMEPQKEEYHIICVCDLIIVGLDRMHERIMAYEHAHIIKMVASFQNYGECASKIPCSFADWRSLNIGPQWSVEHRRFHLRRALWRMLFVGFDSSV